MSSRTVSEPLYGQSNFQLLSICWDSDLKLYSLVLETRILFKVKIPKLPEGHCCTLDHELLSYNPWIVFLVAWWLRFCARDQIPEPAERHCWALETVVAHQICFSVSDYRVVSSNLRTDRMPPLPWNLSFRAQWLRF